MKTLSEALENVRKHLPKMAGSAVDGSPSMKDYQDSDSEEGFTVFVVPRIVAPMFIDLLNQITELIGRTEESIPRRDSERN